MRSWRPQNFVREGQLRGVDDDVINNAVLTAARLRQRSPVLPPIFSLGHLAWLVGASYELLRDVVSRYTVDPYRSFQIRKRPLPGQGKRFRRICVPDTFLMLTQKWIASNLLVRVPAHSASVAFSKGDRIVDAVQPHCESTWLIKMDVVNFFESIDERVVYRVFRRMGYQPLVSFELARLCTRIGAPTAARRGRRWNPIRNSESKISSYEAPRLGHLPQGAPTSPMLANLAVIEMDERLSEVAGKAGFVYSRYADDLAFSSRRQLDRKSCREVIASASAILDVFGFSVNSAKTSVRPPGSRKVLLGLNANSVQPRLSRELRDRLLRHRYFLLHPQIGPAKHAKRLGFDSTIGFKNHLFGLVAYAAQVEPGFAMVLKEDLAQISWPL